MDYHEYSPREIMSAGLFSTELPRRRAVGAAWACALAFALAASTGWGAERAPADSGAEPPRSDGGPSAEAASEAKAAGEKEPDAAPAPDPDPGAEPTEAPEPEPRPAARPKVRARRGVVRPPAPMRKAPYPEAAESEPSEPAVAADTAPAPAATADQSSTRGAGASEAGGGPLDQRTVGYVVGGAGLAMLVVGSAAGIAALDLLSTNQEHCSEARQTCDQQGRDAAEAGRMLGALTTVGWIAGIAGVTGGAYLVLSSPDDEDEPSRTALVSQLGPAGAAFGIAHRW